MPPRPFLCSQRSLIALILHHLKSELTKLGSPVDLKLSKLLSLGIHIPLSCFLFQNKLLALLLSFLLLLLYLFLLTLKFDQPKFSNLLLNPLLLFQFFLLSSCQSVWNGSSKCDLRALLVGICTGSVTSSHSALGSFPLRDRLKNDPTILSDIFAKDEVRGRASVTLALPQEATTFGR